eukprot:980419-Amorphochlora_amoeboformis.AAC.1
MRARARVRVGVRMRVGMEVSFAWEFDTLSQRYMRLTSIKRKYRMLEARRSPMAGNPRVTRLIVVGGSGDWGDVGWET